MSIHSQRFVAGFKRLWPFMLAYAAIMGWFWVATVSLPAAFVVLVLAALYVVGMIALA